MKGNYTTPRISIENNLNNRKVVKIEDIALDSEALMLLDGLQEDLGEHYCKVLRRISDVLIENCEDISIEYDETMRLLQVLGQLREDLRTLTWPRKPEAGKTGFDMYLGIDEPADDSEIIAELELARANDNVEDDDDDSEMQYAGK